VPDSSQYLLLQDLAVVMIVAGIVTLVFHRLRQPVVLGYILAGFLIGPHTPPFGLIQNEDSIRTLGDLGVVFLMFSLGLQFSLRTLKQVGATAFIAASLEIVVMLLLGYHIGQWFGWGRMDSLFLGAMLSITSTTIIVKTLTELGMLRAKFAQLVFGIQIVEDTLGMTMIALLSGLAMTGELELGRLAAAFGRVAVFLSVVLVVGLLVVPPLLRHVARFRSDEMLLITVLGLCFGVTLTAVTLGHSIALGAFLIGTIIGEVREIARIKIITEPVRDMFSAVFFVTIGLLIVPSLLWEYALPIVVISVVVVLGKSLAFTSGTFLSGHDLRTSLRVGTCMVPIGELSFIIAAVGLRLGVTSGFLYPIAVSVSAITMPITPYLIRNSDRIVNWLDRVAPSWLVNYIELYGRWLERIRSQRRDTEGRRLVRKWTLQILLNVMLLSAAFMVAAALGRPAERWWPHAPEAVGGAKGILWLAAALVALPGLIAAFRKLQALGMLVSELSVSGATGGRSTAAVRSLISNTILLGGSVGIGLWVLLISATVLPPWPALLVLLLIVAAVALLLWRFLIQIHAKAQLALRETLSEPTVSPSSDPDQAWSPLLKEAQLATLVISDNMPAAGKRIGDLHLRSATGATILGIERADAHIVNPGPAEQLQPGDTILLLGAPDRIDAACKLLAGH
jgi:CPA2 family monovalent cation:H+ antiporter-2